MNLQETLEILRELKRVGASHFKSQYFEVTLSSGEVPRIFSDPFISNAAPAPSVFTGQHQQSGPVADPAPIVENKEATEKLKNLVDTLKMNDMDLIDKIFPAGAGG